MQLVIGVGSVKFGHGAFLGNCYLRWQANPDPTAPPPRSILEFAIETASGSTWGSTAYANEFDTPPVLGPNGGALFAGPCCYNLPVPPTQVMPPPNASFTAELIVNPSIVNKGRLLVNVAAADGDHVFDMDAGAVGDIGYIYAVVQ